MSMADLKKLVADGYNTIAERYLAWSGLPVTATFVSCGPLVS
jgi:hypothetical protein